LAEPSSPAIAIVNGQPLFRSVYDAQLAMLSGQSPEEDIFGDGNGEYAAPEPPTLADRIELLDIMARIELATQEAYQLGFAPRDEQMVEIEARAVEAAGGARELEEALSGTGATMEQFRNQLARNEAMRAWRDAAFLSRARVTEAEARAFYDSHVAEFTHGDEARALQIMFPLPVVPSAQTEQAKERARTRAKEALTQARNGRDFEELQRVFMDPTTMAAVDGGQLGWVGQLGSFPELEEVIFSLKPGETGGPVETPFSIHIVKVLENRAAGTTSFREARPQIVEMISASKIDYLVQERSAALLDAAEVTVVDPLLATAWAEYRRTGALPAAPPDPGAGAAAEDGSSGDTADDGEPGTDGNPEDSDDAADEAPEDSGEVT
jgi:parvulin-like peptidyl-prolyl isomerase